MGGTTASSAWSRTAAGHDDGFEMHRVNGAAAGAPMNIQAIDLVEIGAGGGPIASRKSRRHRRRDPRARRPRPAQVGYGLGGAAPP